MSEKVYVEQSAVLKALQAAINKQAGKPDALQFLSDILDAPFVPPPASVAPIVRCKDCRYAENTVTGECKYCAYWEDMFQTSNKLYLRADFFCAAGERR